jgi:hypothetical protein
MFDTFEEAFDYVREVNRPVVVVIRHDGHFWKCYPSGKAEPWGIRPGWDE